MSGRSWSSGRGWRALPVVAGLLVCAPGALGQEPAAADVAPCGVAGRGLTSDLSGPREQLIRLAELDGRFAMRARTLRRPSDDVALDLCAADGGDPAGTLVARGPLQIGLDPVGLLAAGNSGYADDRDNGILWAGRGLSTAVSAGAALRLGPLSAAFRPIFTLQQNASFRLRPRADLTHSPWSSGHYGEIDLPQRMGPDSFWRLDAGDTYARVDLLGLAGGWSNENLWIGPAARYPILMSNTAGGFPHAFVGTSKPLDLWLVRVDGELLMGELTESHYFDIHEDNDRNRLSLWTLSLSPRFLRGLEVGVARAYMFDPGEADIDLLRLFASSQLNLAGNELASAYARWLIPASGTEIYGEFARDDRYATIEDDLITEIDHSQAYMFGFSQLSEVAGERVRIQAELAHLQEQQEWRPGRPLPIYYIHSGLKQGYTQRGQLLGASIGPGADAQFLAVDALRGECVCGIFIERVRRNAASGPAIQARAVHPWHSDTELTLGARAIGWWRGMRIGGTMSYSRRWNRDFIENDTNLKLMLDVSWQPLAATRDADDR